MKKLILLGAIAAIGYAVYRQYSANQAEQELWNEATRDLDLRTDAQGRLRIVLPQPWTYAFYRYELRR